MTLGQWITDVREAMRALRGGGTGTVLALVSLTLAMAAGTVTFSVVNAVVLRPLPYRAPDRLVAVSSPDSTASSAGGISPQHYFSLLDGARERSKVSPRSDRDRRFGWTSTADPMRSGRQRSR